VGSDGRRKSGLVDGVPPTQKLGRRWGWEVLGHRCCGMHHTQTAVKLCKLQPLLEKTEFDRWQH
jgi:hypothetical protein